MAALDGMRILDLTQYEAGTSCTQALAWLGADVVKVEPPRLGDPGRTADGGNRDALYFLSLNHNKRSVAINLKSAQGRELFLSLLPKFDAVIENFTLGTMERLGLGYDVLEEHRPGIIYGTIKGFGASGPYKDYKCYDFVAQAAGGAISVTGERDGPPIRPGPTFADSGTGFNMALGILAAYVQQQRTGEGQVVEVSMQDSIINFMRTQLSFRERYPDGVVRRRGNRTVSPTNLYPCAPGGPNDYIQLMVVTDRMWDALITAIGRPELGTDERFATITDRRENGDALDEEISAWTMQRTKWEAMEFLAAAGVPASAVFDSHDILSHPHLVERGQVVTYDHPTYGEQTMPASPIRMSASQVPMQRAPLLGEHTHELLERELDLSTAEVEQLRAEGVIGPASRQPEDELATAHPRF
ncbi:MAG: formyl-CoA transferase [Dehalococcoidia bacterium]|nr:formyl-CoA transferase [Dehalococcoidia bacterium]